MGNLYNDEVDLTTDVTGLPKYEKGYLEGIMCTKSYFRQRFIGEMLDDVLAERLGHYINFTKEEELLLMTGI